MVEEVINVVVTVVGVHDDKGKLVVHHLKQFEVRDLSCFVLMNLNYRDYYRVSTRKVHFSPPDRKTKVNFFCGHPVFILIPL